MGTVLLPAKTLANILGLTLKGRANKFHSDHGCDSIRLSKIKGTEK